MRHLLHLSNTTNLFRGPGLFEQFHIARSELGLDGSVAVVAQYSGCASLNKPLVYATLARVIPRLGSLGMQVNAEGRTPVFVRLPSVPLPDVVTLDTTARPLESVLSILLARSIPYGTQLPLWRLVVLPDNKIIFAYNHAIGDGQSGLAFHRVFLTALKESPYPPQDASDVVVVSPNTTIEPPVESLTDTTVSWSTFFRMLLDTLLPASFTAGASAWTMNPVTEEPTLNTNVRVWEIPAPSAESFLELCRRHQTSLTGALHTIAVLVWSRLGVLAEPSTKYKSVSCEVPVSLRKYTRSTPEVMGDFISGYSSFTPFIRRPPGGHPLESFPWDAASSFTSSLHASVGTSRELIGTLRYLVRFGAMKGFFTGMLGKKRSRTMELSNLGGFKPASSPQGVEDLWTITDAYFGQSNPVCGAAMKINVVGCPSGAINVVFTWGEGAIGAALADAFVTGMKSQFFPLIAPP